MRGKSYERMERKASVLSPIEMNKIAGLLINIYNARFPFLKWVF